MSRPHLRDQLLRAIAWKCEEWEKESCRDGRYYKRRQSDDKFQIGDESIRLFDPNLNAVLYRNGYEGYWVKPVLLNPFEKNIDTVRLLFGRIHEAHQIGSTYVCEMEFIVKPRELKAFHYFSVDSVLYADLELCHVQRDYSWLSTVLELRQRLLRAAGTMAWLRLAERLAEDRCNNLSCRYTAALARGIPALKDRKIRQAFYGCLESTVQTRCEQRAFSRLIPESLCQKHLQGRMPQATLHRIQQRLMSPLSQIKATLPVTGTQPVAGYYISHLKAALSEGQVERSVKPFVSEDFSRRIRAENPDVCERIKKVMLPFTD